MVVFVVKGNILLLFYIGVKILQNYTALLILPSIAKHILLHWPNVFVYWSEDPFKSSYIKKGFTYKNSCIKWNQKRNLYFFFFSQELFLSFLPLTIPSSLTATLQSFIGLNSCYKIIVLFHQRYFLSLALFNLPLWKVEEWLRKKRWWFPGSIF